MKKKLTKVLASLLAVMSMTVSVNAAVYYDVSYPWMDDVFRLDYESMYGGAAGTTESGDDANTVENTLCMLGIMKRDEAGKFNPSAKLSRAAYEAAIRVIYSNEAVDFAEYEKNYEGQAVKQEEIVARLLSFVESAGIDTDTIDVEEYAAATGITKGIVYSANKDMTRRDFATIVWNTLNSEYVQFTYENGAFSMQSQPGKTLLQDKMNVYEIKGVLNAVQGYNIYSVVSPKAGFVEVDQIKYATNGIQGLEDLLGYTVTGYAEYDPETQSYTIISIEKSAKDDTVVIDLKNYESKDSKYIYYTEEEKTKKVEIDAIETVVYNGDIVGAIENTMLDGIGSIQISKSEKNGEYDIAIIKEYQNFYTTRYVAETERLYVAYEMKFNGEFFVDLSDDDANYIIELDGKAIDKSALKAKLAIAVMQNTNGTYTEILASTKSVTGTVAGETDNGWLIEGDEYMVDPAYDAASNLEGSVIPPVANAVTGSFCYTPHGVIVSFEPEGTAKYALLRKTWVDEETEKTQVKLFTTDGVWAIYEVEDRAKVDGVRVNSEDVYDRLTNVLGDNNANSPTPIRCVVVDEKVTFIDTIQDNPEEAKDIERMIPAKNSAGQYRIKFQVSWVKGWNIPGNIYHVPDSTTMFVVPKDVTKEDEYRITTATSIPASTTTVASYAELSLFNADDYYITDLVILHTEGEQASTWAVDDFVFIYIRGISQKMIDGELVEGIDCYQQTRSTSVLTEKFYELPENWQQKFGMDDLAGVFVGVQHEDGMITKLSTDVGPYVKDYKIINNTAGYGGSPDCFYTWNGSTDWVSATVLDVDVSKKYIKMDCGKDGIKSAVFAAYTIAAIDTKDGKKYTAEPIEVEDINPGDRIYYWGSYSRAYNCLVIKNYED